MLSIQAATADKGRALGWSAAFIEATTRKNVSEAHRGAIAGALERSDVAYADAYLNRYAGQMEASDVLRVRGLVSKEMDARAALTIAGRTMAEIRPRLMPSDNERAFNIAVGTESNHRQFAADGSPLRSPKGATGIAQVMPATGPEAAKLAGLPWDKARFENDADYNKALGRAYFDQQLKDFGGNLPMAYAAYNAGPGATREAVTRAKASPGGDWLTFLPQETQKYVAKNMKAFGSGEGAPARATIEDVHAAIRKQVGIDNPTRLRLALDEGTRQFEDTTKAMKQQDDAAEADAMRWLTANGGRYSQMPAKLKAALPPGKVDDVMNFGQRIAKGDDTTDPAIYLKLTDHERLRGLSDNEFSRFAAALRIRLQALRPAAAERRQGKRHGRPGQFDGECRPGRPHAVNWHEAQADRRRRSAAARGSSEIRAAVAPTRTRNQRQEVRQSHDRGTH